MFKRSRKKIILSIMISLILLFAVTLSVILFASYQEIRGKDRDMLARYVEMYALDGSAEPGQRPDGGEEPRPKPDGQNDPADRPIDERRDYQLSTFYSVAFSEDRSVLKADNGDKAVYEEEELIRIAEEVLSKGKASGRMGTLSYIVSQRDTYTLVAFMDTTVTDNGMSLLLRNVLIVGGAAIVLLFFISLILARHIVRPLEENDQRQKQFISDASHELKTPVAVIGTNAEMLSRELGENEWLSNIRYENERMGDLVKQLLDLSRAENAETPMEELDLSRIVTGETLAFESLAYDQGKTIQSEIGEGLRITGNESQMKQLASVLLDNALRHSTGTEIDVTLRREAHAAVLSVANESEEIPPEKLAHLFDRFYRADEARTGEDFHYGLGLSIAKAAAEKHGGSINASCKAGKVIFTVSLPLKK